MLKRPIHVKGTRENPEVPPGRLGGSQVLKILNKTILALTAISLLLAVVARIDRGFPRARLSSYVLQMQGNPEPESPAPHPFGRPVQGPLPWEGDPRLEQLRAEHGAGVLVAAFQTTLPNPILGEEFNVGLAADRLAGTVVVPGEVFSLNRLLGPYTKVKGYQDGPMYVGGRIVPSEGGGICKIATTLYNVVTLSNLKVVERHPHSMMVPYVPPGQDATVAYGSFDFRFLNSTGGPIIIWSDTVDTTLFIAIYGQTPPPRVMWGHQTLRRWPPNEVRRTNPRLAPGTEMVVEPGYDGLVVRSWLMVEQPDGTTARHDLGVDTYRAMARIIEVGP